MFIFSKVKVRLPGDDENKVTIDRDYVGTIADEYTKSEYFEALVKAGKIVVPESTTDRELQKVAEAEVKLFRGLDSPIETISEESEAEIEPVKKEIKRGRKK